VSAFSPWEEPSPVWTSATWVQGAPGPDGTPTWAIQRRLLGFAIPAAAVVPVPLHVPVVEGAVVEAPGSPHPPTAPPALPAPPSTPPAVVRPTMEAVVLTLSPDAHPPSVQSVPVATPGADTQNKSSQTVHTASPKTPPAKMTRPKTLKTTIVAIPKSAMVSGRANEYPKATTRFTAVYYKF